MCGLTILYDIPDPFGGSHIIKQHRFTNLQLDHKYKFSAIKQTSERLQQCQRIVLIYSHIDKTYIYEDSNKEKFFFWRENENTETC
jgi:hypothetical protein